MRIHRLIAAATAALALAAMMTPAAAMTPLDPLPDAGHASFVTQNFQSSIGNDIDLTGARGDALTIDLLTAATVLASDSTTADAVNDDPGADGTDLQLGESIDLGGADGHFGHFAGT